MQNVKPSKNYIHHTPVIFILYFVLSDLWGIDDGLSGPWLQHGWTGMWQHDCSAGVFLAWRNLRWFSQEVQPASIPYHKCSSQRQFIKFFRFEIICSSEVVCCCCCHCSCCWSIEFVLVYRLLLFHTQKLCSKHRKGYFCLYLFLLLLKVREKLCLLWFCIPDCSTRHSTTNTEVCCLRRYSWKLCKVSKILVIFLSDWPLQLWPTPHLTHLNISFWPIMLT